MSSSLYTIHINKPALIYFTFKRVVLFSSSKFLLFLLVCFEMYTTPSIGATPKLSGFDEEIEVCGSHFQPNSPITISLSIVYFDVLYISYGHFYSDGHGKINLKHQPSFGGFYFGIQANGLFSGMKPMPSNHACPGFVVKGNVEETQVTFDLNVWKGHLTQDQTHQLHVRYDPLGTGQIMTAVFEKYFLCSSALTRSFMSPRVKREIVKDTVDNESIIGVLFLPSGNGPFPGHLDISGEAGGCLEYRSALLAKHGFVSLSLAYFNAEGLKAKSIYEYRMTYFDKAAKYLTNHPSVRPGGITLTGISLGSQIALLEAIRNPNIIGCICISTATSMRTDPSIVNPSLLYDEHCYEIMNGISTGIHGYKTEIDRPLLTHKHDNPILFLLGDQDPRRTYADDVMDQLLRSGKKNLSKVVIEGQGHLIEPPFVPMATCTSSSGDFGISNNRGYEGINNWGGIRRTHNSGQQDAWKVLLDFLAKCHKITYSKL